MNTQRLEENSEYQRQQIENTIGELRQRLSPGQLLDEVLAYTKDGGGEFLSNFGRQATANPLPVTLIGAGLAWLLFSKANGSGAGDGSSFTSHTGRHNGPTGDTGATAEGLGQKAAEATGEAWNTVQSTAGNVSAQAKDAISTAKDAVSAGASAIGENTRSVAGKAKNLAGSSVSFLKDEPLVLLGAGLAIGAAVGASLPTTQTEEKLVGSASADLKSQVGDIASDLKDAGKDLSNGIAESLKDQVGGNGTSPDAYH